MLNGTEYFECQCGSDEHTIHFTLDVEENEIYLSVFLNQYRSFFKRAWVAVKYLFNYKCKYGHWDCVTIQNDDAERLISLLRRLEK